MPVGEAFRIDSSGYAERVFSVFLSLS